jgi:formylglycine-generating enzyme required for sulfatase activity
VAAGEALADETWACAVTAGDGSASGAAGDDEVLVESACGDGSVTLTASGIQFVTVCGGTFDMGCTPGQSSCQSNEFPVRTTTLTRDYYMSRTEVTQGQFAALMGYNPSVFWSGGANKPVEQVSWFEAAAFANAVSSAAGLPRCYTCTGSSYGVYCTGSSDPYTCDGYRLPTEAEWEGAARCGEDLMYAGSDIIATVAWYSVNSGLQTHSVGGLASNACGLYDMSGNVFEWTNDRWSSSAYGVGALTDPPGPASGYDRVYRGGSWAWISQESRVAFRGALGQAYNDFRIGIRLVRNAP